MMTQRVIDHFQSVEIGVENYWNLLIAANRGQMLFSYGQETTPVIKTSKLIYERKALQRRLCAFAFRDVLNLKDEVRGLVV